VRKVPWLVIFALTALTTGCVPNASRPVFLISTPFSDTDFEPWAVSGPANLRGQAFLKTVGGDVKTCARNEVALMPAIAYNREVMKDLLSIAGQVNFKNRNAAANNYLRKGTCDAQGYFSFSTLPALSWYVIVDVKWGVPQRYGISEQGGVLGKLVDLHPGANDTIMSAQDEMP
jgi:hypothetical protein